MENRVLWNHKTIKYPPLSHSLNALVKGARNLRSLIVESGNRINNFKVIRKARTLQNLEFTIKTSQIISYPQLFKRGLESLQSVTLYVKWCIANQKNLQVDKFFGFLLNLPKLQHLAVWFEEGGDYFKTLLLAIHTKKIPSFHIIASNPDISEECHHMNWGKCIEALYIGPIPHFQDHPSSNAWLPAQKQEKRLRLNTVPEIGDFMNQNNTIKTLETMNLLYLFTTSQTPDLDLTLLNFIAQTKALEDLIMVFEETLPIANTAYDDFNRKFTHIEPLENLKTFTFSLSKKEKGHGKISSPYGLQMKNLRTLCLKIAAKAFDLSSFTEALKDLVKLESFNFNYQEAGKPDLSIDCSFPLEQLRRLKSVSFDCNLPFSETSMDQLVESIPQLGNLESLKIEGQILDGLVRKKASALIGDLCFMKNLEIASLSWKEADAARWTRVNMRRMNGEMIISSGRKV